MSPRPPSRPGMPPGGGAEDPDGGASGGDWGALFEGSNSREILVKLITGDPLELGPRCRALLEERSLLMSLDRLHFRSAARIAYLAYGRGGRGLGRNFVEERIEASLRDLLEEDDTLILPEEADVDLREAPYPRVAAILGLEPLQAVGACAAFNGLPDALRRMCFPVLIQGLSLKACHERGLGSPAEILEGLRTALRAIERKIGHAVAWPPADLNGGADEGR